MSDDLFETSDTPPEKSTPQGQNNLSPEEQERIHALHEALLTEFHDTSAKTSSASALEDIEELKTDFLASLKYIVRHADSLALRAKVAMWGYQILIDQGKASRDPLADLLGGIPSSAEKAADRSRN